MLGKGWKQHCIRRDAVPNRLTTLFGHQNGVFLFVVANAEGKKQEFLVDMRKTGSFYLGRSVPGQKVKPDVTVTVSDKDMVSLSTGKLNVSGMTSAHPVEDANVLSF